MISLNENTYHNLAKLGDLEDSFDTVISKLIEVANSQNNNVAMARGSLAGSTDAKAAASPPPITNRRDRR